MNMAKLTEGNKDLQQRYIAEIGADNDKTKARIALLKNAISTLEMSIGVSAAPARTFRSSLGLSTMKSLVFEPVDNSTSEVVLSSAQEQQAALAVEESLKTKVENLNRIKEGVLSLKVEIEDKKLKREEITRLYEQKKEEVEKTETELKEEIKKLKKNISFDSVYAKRELFNIKKAIEETQNKMIKTQEIMEKLNKDKEACEKDLEEVKNEGNDSYALKLAKSRTIVAPLEDATKTIEDQKEKLKARIEKERKEYIKSCNLYMIQEEDARAREMQRAEMAKEKKLLLKQMNKFKEDYKEELQLFFEQLEVEEQLNDLIKEKIDIEDKVALNEKERAKLNKKVKESGIELKKFKDQLNDTDKAVIEEIRMNEKTIKNLEEAITKRLENIDCKPLIEIMMEEISKKSALYDKAIFNIQQKLVDKEIEKMIEEQSATEDGISKKIKDIKMEIENMKDQNPGIKKIKESQIQIMEDKLSEAHLLFQAKMEAVEKWKIQMRAKFESLEEGNTEQELLADDARTVETIYRKIVIKIEDTKEKAEFQQEFNEYIEKLKEREQSIQKVVARGENLRARIEELKEEIKTYKDDIEQLEREYLKYKSDLNGLTPKLKDLEEQNDYRTAQLELELHKQGEEVFKQFLKKNEEMFKELKRTYGNKIAEKKKQEDKKKITELAVAQHAKRRNMVKKVFKEIQHMNKIIKGSDDKLIPHIESAKRVCEHQEARIAKMNGQLAGIIELENEAVVQIEAFFQRKKNELDHFLEIFYRKKNYEFAFQKLVELRAKIEKKKQRMSDLKVKLEALKKKREEERTSHAIQSVQQKIRLDTAQKQLEEIQKVYKTQITILGKQAKNFNLLIESDKRRVEIMNDKLSSSINNLKLTKQILGQKYKSVEDIHVPEVEPVPVIEPSIEEVKHSPEENYTKSEEMVKKKLRYEVIDMDAFDSEEKESSEEELVLEKYMKQAKDEEKEEEPKRFIHSGFNEKKSKYKIDIVTCPTKEKELFDNIKTVFEGMPIYKKYTAQSTLNAKRAFDPLQSSTYPPDTCGFGKRLLIYNPDDNKLEFRLLDGVTELSIPLDKVINVLIPTETTKIIKAQQAFGTTAKGDSKAKSVVLTKVDRQLENETYRERCKNVMYYPYALIINDKRIELIAETYTVYKYSVQALKQLIKNQMLLKSLKKHLQKESLAEEPDSS